ncbi:ABC transporter substrate-binding protein [candidate division KSB1 bacterium]
MFFSRSFDKTAVLIVFLFIVLSGISSGYQRNETVILRWGELQKRIQSLNPLKEGTYEEHNIRKLIFGQHLFEYDPDNREFVPGIVDDDGWTAYPDSLRWIINIKDNLFFHDGSRVTTDDVKFSIEFFSSLITFENRHHNVQLRRIREIRVISPAYFQIDLIDKIDALPQLLADIPILSKKYYTGESLESVIENIDSKRPMGYGPFKFNRFDPDSLIVFDRHTLYFGGIPGFEQIMIRLYPNENLMTSDFITGSLDFMPINNLEQLREISHADSNFNVFSQLLPYQSMVFLNYNINDPLISSLDIRKALSQAFNRIEYVRSSFQFDVRQSALGPLPEDSWAYFHGYDRPAYSPARAQTILKNAQWDDTDGDGILDRSGRKFILNLIYHDNDKYFEILVRLLKRDLGNIGISIEEEPVTLEEMRNRVRSSQFQVALDYSFYYPYDIVRTFYDFFDIEGTTLRRNRLGSSSAQAVRQLQRAAQTQNQFAARAIFERLQDLHNSVYASNYFSSQHSRYVVVNGYNVDSYYRANELLPIAQWTRR